jgi:hypothetical protein
VEGPQVLRAVVEAAEQAGVTVNRVSQGSGAMLLSEAELAEMARIGADHGIEVSLFTGPREEWDIGRSAYAADGASLSGRLRGSRQLRYALEDVLRGVEQGIRGFLIADTGLLELVAGLQAVGELPACVVWKVSAVMAPSNPLTLRQLERLGGSTVNVPADVTTGQLAEMRALAGVPIDLYVEAPDAMGGIVRGHEAADLIAVAAPMYVKFGLRNSRPLYPSGVHLAADAAAIAREKVHRAAVALEWIARSGMDLVQSAPGAPGLGVPEPAAGPPYWAARRGCRGTTRSRWPAGRRWRRPGARRARRGAAGRRHRQPGQPAQPVQPAAAPARRTQTSRCPISRLGDGDKPRLTREGARMDATLTTAEKMPPCERRRLADHAQAEPAGHPVHLAAVGRDRRDDQEHQQRDAVDEPDEQEQPEPDPVRERARDDRQDEQHDAGDDRGDHHVQRLRGVVPDEGRLVLLDEVDDERPEEADHDRAQVGEHRPGLLVARGLRAVPGHRGALEWAAVAGLLAGVLLRAGLLAAVVLLAVLWRAAGRLPPILLRAGLLTTVLLAAVLAPPGAWLFRRILRHGRSPPFRNPVTRKTLAQCASPSCRSAKQPDGDEHGDDRQGGNRPAQSGHRQPAVMTPPGRSRRGRGTARRGT